MHDGDCVMLSIQSTDEHGDISLSTRGHLLDTPEGWLLRYEETNPDDLSATQTLLLCEGERVTVTRTGAILSTIVFEQHETFFGDYPTPVGNFQLRVFASEVSVQRRGLLGHIRLVYQISLQSAYSPVEETSTRTLDIRFTPCRA